MMKSAGPGVARLPSISPMTPQAVAVTVMMNR
jgi:hypothetical protein